MIPTPGPRRTGRRLTRALLPAAAVAALLGLGGCSLGSQGIYSLPLPGGPSVGADGYVVTAEFTDALDLVPQAAVKVDNVAIGKVTKIALSSDGRSAIVTMSVGGQVDLPANATARITQTSLLGEKFVSLDRPQTGATGSLRATHTIGLEGTTEAVDAERVFGAMSLLLNGGGIGQFQQISKELAAVSAGREPEIRQFLTNIASFVQTLNTRKQSITDALDSLDRLGKTLNANTTQLTTALDKLPPGLQVLVDQRTQLVSMLNALDSLSQVTVSTLTQSKDDIVADLQRLDPILTQLAASGKALPDALQILFTFPFPDSVLSAVKGDYVNAFLVTNFSTPGTTIPSTTASTGWPTGYPGTVVDPTKPSAGKAAVTTTTPAQIGPPPMILPPTSSAAPGVPTPTIPTPTGTPTGTGTPTSGTITSGTSTGTSTSTGSAGSPTSGTTSTSSGPSTTATPPPTSGTPSSTPTTRKGGKG